MIIHEYTEQDAPKPNNNCGQIAIANHLVNTTKVIFLQTTPEKYMNDFAKEIYSIYPPMKVFGTSKYTIKKASGAMEAFGLENLKDAIDNNKFPILLLNLQNWWPIGHWVVASSYDDHGINLMNHGYESWRSFLEKWQQGFVTYWAGTQNKFWV